MRGIPDPFLSMQRVWVPRLGDSMAVLRVSPILVLPYFSVIPHIIGN